MRAGHENGRGRRRIKGGRDRQMGGMRDEMEGEVRGWE